MIEIDGAEGGGQMLRTAVSLAAVVRQPVRLYSIRGARPQPGLRAQHMTGIDGVAKLCGAQVSGLEIGSRELVFEPGAIRAGTFSFSVGTAGSVSLVVQTMAPVAAFGPGPVAARIEGGTHVSWSPPFEHLAHGFFPMIGRMGYVLDRFKIARWGWYPRGGGLVEFGAKPVQKLNGLDLSWRGDLVSIGGVSVSSQLPPHVAQRQAESAAAELAGAGYQAQIGRLDGASPGPGSAVVLWAAFDNGLMCASALGKRGLAAETVGKNAAKALIDEIGSGAAVDRHLGDQLMIYAALAEGRTDIAVPEITTHMRTNAAVIEAFLPVKFRLERKTISITGAGFANAYL